MIAEMVVEGNPGHENEPDPFGDDVSAANEEDPAG